MIATTKRLMFALTAAAAMMTWMIAGCGGSEKYQIPTGDKLKPFEAPDAEDLVDNDDDFFDEDEPADSDEPADTDDSDDSNSDDSDSDSSDSDSDSDDAGADEGAVLDLNPNRQLASVEGGCAWPRSPWVS